MALQQATQAVQPTSNVDVIDRLARLVGTTRSWWLNELRSGRAFLRGALLTAGVGVYSHVQLFNPAGSGKTVLVAGVQVCCSGTQQVSLRAHNAALATLVGTGFNCVAGAAVAAAVIRTENNAAQQGTQLVPMLALANTHIPLLHDDFVMELGEGEGLLVNVDVVNQGLYGIFRWVEV